MNVPTAGELVRVDSGGPVLDGLVFDTPSREKIVVAVVDPARGPGFRTVHPDTLSEREEEGPDDHALKLLVRRTPPPPPRGKARGGTGSGAGREGHGRATMHRTTGK